MKVFKSIAFAFPTSQAAAHLGFTKTGCYFVQSRTDDPESGQSSTVVPHDAEGFAAPDDPDLIALFREYDGEPCPMFLRYGPPGALAALKSAGAI